jgi:rhodanese-related sulfurtransferase
MCAPCGAAIGGLEQTMRLEESFEISAHELAEKLKSATPFHVLDVRENWEISLASIQDLRLVVLPMSQIARLREQAFSPELSDFDAEIVVMCHHGVRSLQVTRWMRSQGWKRVFSLAGGIDAYASQIDPQVGFY